MDVRGAGDSGVGPGLSAFVDFVGDACFVVDPSGTIVEANSRALADYGYARADFIGMDVRQLCAPESEPLFTDGLVRWIGNGGLFDATHVRANGQDFVGEFRASPAGSLLPGGIAITMREVTELRECQEDLELKSLMLEGSMDAIIVHDTQGELIYFNEAAAEQSGLTVSQFAVLGPFGWIPADAHGHIVERMRLLHELGSLRFDSHLIRPDGVRVHTEVSSRLVETLQGELVISVTRDVTERIAAQDAMHHLAYHDTLTGLPNRMMLEEQLSLATAAADRHGDLVGIIFIDLDDFKPVNDEHGHAIGDAVLQGVAQRMRECVRAYDTVARLGGDEFLILCPGLNAASDLSTIAHKVSDAVSIPTQLNNVEVTVNGSLGLALYEPGEPLDRLIARADSAMYVAKQQRLSGWESFLEP